MSQHALSIANNQEYERMTTNAVVSERTLREIYLANFEIAINKGDPWALMTSYNKINGYWSNSNKHLMTDILRKEWGYEGVVMSDGMGIQTNKTEAHNNGIDAELEYYHEHLGEIMSAYNAGEITMDIIDEHLRRIFELYFCLEKNGEPIEVDHNAQHQIAIEAAEASIVLLKNENQHLPLSKDSPIALIGSIVKLPTYIGGRSGYTKARKLDNAYDGFAEIIGEDKISYVPGYPNYNDPTKPNMDAYDEKMLDKAVETAKQAEKVILFVGNTFGIESEGYDRLTLDLPRGQQALIHRVCNVNSDVILVVSAGSAVNLSPFVNKVKAIVFNWLGDEGMGTATARMIYGLAEPGGRLPETFPIDIRNTPDYNNFPAYPNPTHEVHYGKGIYVGYRWYEARGLPVLYPFGFGLSYSTFEISNPVISAGRIGSNDTLKVSIKIKNVGKRAGSEVIQLYVKDIKSSIDRPEKELKAFKKVHLKPGEEKIAEMELSSRAFAFYSTDMCDWVVEDGMFEILIGNSSANCPLSVQVKVDSNEKITRYHRMTPIDCIWNDPNFAKAVFDFPEKTKKALLQESGMRAIIVMMPIYRLTSLVGIDTDMLPNGLTMEQVDIVLKRLNEM